MFGAVKPEANGRVRSQAWMYLNPNGVLSSSPGLRGTSYPGKRRVAHLPQRGCGQRAQQPNIERQMQAQPPWGVSHDTSQPRVARASQP